MKGGGMFCGLGLGFPEVLVECLGFGVCRTLGFGGFARLVCVCVCARSVGFRVLLTQETECRPEPKRTRLRVQGLGF